MISSPQILGMPTVREWFCSAVINCACVTKHALLLSGFGQPTTCPECKRSWVITRLRAHPLTGDIGIEVVGVVLREQPALTS